MSLVMCDSLLHVIANMGNLYNDIILHAQMNVGFYGHSADWADGLEGCGLLECPGGIVISSDKFLFHAVLLPPFSTTTP